jgi:DNA mismatch endonuclease, patch repair protein
MDWLDKKTRSKIMASIKSKGTKPELILKKALRGQGFSYQPKIKGSPDFINRKRKIAIFMHGCFWHRCPKCYREPASRKKYWLPKIENNVIRDRKNTKVLKERGYKVLKIWEHDIPKKIDRIINKIKKI